MQELKELNQEIEDFVKGAPVWKDKDALLQSVPGVGPVTSATMLGMLSGLEKFNRQEIAALVGVAPVNKDSGRKQGKRRVYRGRAEVDGVEHIPALDIGRGADRLDQAIHRDVRQRIRANLRRLPDHPL